MGDLIQSVEQWLRERREGWPKVETVAALRSSDALGRVDVAYRWPQDDMVARYYDDETGENGPIAYRWNRQSWTWEAAR